MKYLLSVSLLTTLLVSTTGAWPVGRSPSATEEVQVIEVTAKKYEFNPSTIRVKQGTRVRLKITATDHTHGFRIREVAEGDATGKPGIVFSSPQDCQKIEEGKTETVEFVAQKAGTYPFKCCVRCGWHHRSMKGDLIVE